MDNIGLILEGGGMRGLYTGGVLDFFLENNLNFPYVVGVSAGACNAASYISKQHGRNKRVNINYIKESKYLSYRNLITEGSLFGMDYLFNEIPDKLDPFDYDTFNASEQKFYIGTTDCITGEAIYFSKNNCDNVNMALRASCSLPYVSQIVHFQNKYLLDGGIADSIPIKKSIEDGNTKHIIILTRNENYRKKASRLNIAAKGIYRKYPELAKAIANRYSVYNETLNYIKDLEKQGKVFIIRPLKPVMVNRIEKDQDRLRELYKLGYADAVNCYTSLIEWINS